MLAFIDEIVIPFLESLYGAVGYAGVMVAMAIESAMVPLPSELILPFGGFMVSDATQIEPITGQPWSFWIVVIVATIGNTLGSLVATIRRMPPRLREARSTDSAAYSTPASVTESRFPFHWKVGNCAIETEPTRKLSGA